MDAHETPSTTADATPRICHVCRGSIAKDHVVDAMYRGSEAIVMIIGTYAKGTSDIGG